MIVPMKRVQVAARCQDREMILEALGRLAAVHIVPSDPSRAVPDEQLAARAARVAQARQILRRVRPAGERPDLDAQAAADEVLTLRRRGAEHQARLDALHRRATELEAWGEAWAEQVAGLDAAGVTVRLVAVPDDAVHLVRGETVAVLGQPGRHEMLMLAAGGPGQVVIPAGARSIPPPERGRSAILAAAAELEAGLERDRARLAALAHLRPALDELAAVLEDQLRWSVARRGLVETGPLCGLEGWIPEDRISELEVALGRGGVVAAVRFSSPDPEENPPTLVRYPRWAEPIRGLLDLLGTTPGYSELDLGAFFMIALPIFAGMIIADAGYGLVFLILPLLFAARSVALLGVQRRRLVLTFGVTAAAWGALTGVWFGFTPTQMIDAGGVAGALGDAIWRLQWIRGSEDETRVMVTKICLLIGSVHLVTGHLRRALALWPSQRAVAELGWCIVLLAMGGLIWILLFGAEGWVPDWASGAVAAGLAAGGALVVLFMAPDPNPVRRLGLGLAGTVLPLIGTFSDTLSYIRLMAVGLAGTHIGAAFDTMALSIMGQGTWAILPGALVLVGGHLLNMGLIVIAIVAHGVRLNMLEFSSHAGVKWSGYAFRPLAIHQAGET
jgi:V/A-type H+/Na+-transporting ATPase subunit I